MTDIILMANAFTLLSLLFAVAFGVAVAVWLNRPFPRGHDYE